SLRPLLAFFLLLIPRPPISTLFPYTTLFRSHALLKQDSDYVSLTDSSLPCASGSFVYSGFQEPFASCDGARKLLTIYTGYDPQGHLYDGVANVVIVGRWGIVKNAGQFDGQTGLSI